MCGKGRMLLQNGQVCVDMPVIEEGAGASNRNHCVEPGVS